MGYAVSRLVFQPRDESYRNDPSLIWLESRLGHRTPAVFINRNAYYTFILAHGNAEDIGSIYESICDMALGLDVNVLAYEYSGYGPTKGLLSTTEAAVYANAEAALDYLIKTLNIPSDRIILYGRSVGSGPSIHLASRHKVGGLVLQSGFTSIFRIFADFRFSLPFDIFCNIDKKVGCPVLLIHGELDEVVPVRHALHLCREFLKTGLLVDLLLLKEAGHNDIQPNSIYPRIGKFLNQISSHVKRTGVRLPA